MKRIFAGVNEHAGQDHIELFRIGIPNNKTWTLKEIRCTSLTQWGTIVRVYINGQIMWEISVQRHTTPHHINEIYKSGTEIIFESDAVTAHADIISSALVIDEA